MKNISKFMRELSLLYFIVLGCVVFLTILPMLVISLIASLVFPRAKEVYSFVLFMGIKFFLFIAPVKYGEKKIKNITSLSPEKYLIIANHRSYLDMFIFLSHVHKLRAVANANLFRVPILGHVMKASNHFPMERGNIKTYQRALDDIRLAFSSPSAVLFFPEMTRCNPGHRGIQHFGLTPFQLARENNICIIPVVLHGTDAVWPKGKMSADFKNKVSIKSLEIINPNNFSSSAHLSEHVHRLMEQTLLEMGT